MQEWDEQKDRLSTETRIELQALKEAIQQYRQNRLAKTVQQLNSARLGKNTAVADYFLYFLGLSLKNSPNRDEARSAFQRLLKEYPFSRLAMQAAVELAQGELERKNYTQALEWLSQPAKTDDPLFLLTRAKAMRGTKDYRSSALLLEKIYFQMPTAKEALEAKQLLRGMQQTNRITSSLPSLAWDRVEHLLEAGQLRQAYSESLRATVPVDSPGKYRALFLKGRTAFAAHRYSAAIGFFKVIDDIPIEQCPEAKLFLALCYQKQKAYAAFISACQTLRMQFPKHPATEEALFHLANFYLQKGQSDMTVAIGNQSAELFPAGRLIQPVLWRLAWSFYQQKQYPQAAEMFLTNLNRFTMPSYRRAAFYWLGRSLQNLKENDRALAAYGELNGQPPLDYYGILAQKEIRLLSGSSTPGEAAAGRSRLYLNQTSIPKNTETSLPVDSAQNQILLRRVLELAEANLLPLALEEIEHLQKSESPNQGMQLLKARILNQMGQRIHAVSILAQVIPGYSSLDLDALPRSLWEILYPLEHWSAIRKNSQKERLEPHLVAAMIRQESLFQADAKSRANAIGLMQILPTTGQELAKNLGKPFSVSKLYQAEFNIQLGTRYFSNLLHRFGGRWDLALAAYNAGLQRVSTWLKQLPEDSAEFIESIPLTETRNYVKSIITHREHYRLLYAE